MSPTSVHTSSHSDSIVESVCLARNSWRWSINSDNRAVPKIVVLRLKEMFHLTHYQSLASGTGFVVTFQFRLIFPLCSYCKYRNGSSLGKSNDYSMMTLRWLSPWGREKERRLQIAISNSTVCLPVCSSDRQWRDLKGWFGGILSQMFYDHLAIQMVCWQSRPVDQ